MTEQQNAGEDEPRDDEGLTPEEINRREALADWHKAVESGKLAAAAWREQAALAEKRHQQEDDAYYVPRLPPRPPQPEWKPRPTTPELLESYRSAELIYPWRSPHFGR